MTSADRLVIVGAGPAGLAAAYELMRNGKKPLILDRNDRVGGLARTFWYKGYGFDVGPHRFFTKNIEIQSLWKSLLGDDFREVNRLTRICYRGRFFEYPLKPVQTLLGLGPLTSLEAAISYIAEQCRRDRPEPKNFEQWIVQRFGKKLFSIFFKSYTEKVWGIPCSQIGEEWAAQRIRGLNFVEVLRDALGFKRRGHAAVKSLANQFYYPRLGAGQMYSRLSEEIIKGGGDILLGARVNRLVVQKNRIVRLVYLQGGQEHRIPVSHVFTSAPINDLVRMLDPGPPKTVLKTSRVLYYRGHITVNLIVQGQQLFPDNWLYIHSPDVQMARVANYNNFSSAMIAQPQTSALSAEYFEFAGGPLWKMADSELLQLAEKELARLKLIKSGSVLDGFVIREPDAYPAYYLGHQDHFNILYEHVKHYQNLTSIGRAGMYRYNNQDHAALTGIYAARNHLGLSRIDLRTINADQEYLEEES